MERVTKVKNKISKSKINYRKHERSDSMAEELTHIFGPYSKKRYRCGLPMNEGKVANIFGPRPSCQTCWVHFQAGTQYNSSKSDLARAVRREAKTELRKQHETAKDRNLG